MLKIVGMEFIQLIRKPLWLSIFAVLIFISIFLPHSNITDLTVVPGMVYFVMIMTLILSMYGAEQARTEINQQVDETISVTPKYRKNVIGKLLYWLFLSLLIYLIFYIAVLGYIRIVHNNITFESIIDSFKYTVLCWFIPFYFSIIIGFGIYSWISNIFSYLFIIIVWFMTMPYNSMIGILPRKLSGWLINGDPNIREIFSTSKMEGLEINNGYFSQRAFMFLLLISIFLLSKYKRNVKIRAISLSLLIISLLIPILSPYVPYIIDEDRLDSAKLILPDDKIGTTSNYEISKYIFHLKHGASNHKLNYNVAIEINAKADIISFALLNDFHIISIKMDDIPIIVERSDNLVQLKLPELSGLLEMEIETKTFNPVGPTTVQLVSTSPWYPMNPKEAVDTYGNGIKETYEIFWDSAQPNPILSNLNEVDDSHWVGEAYGPTLLMGNFSKVDNLTFPYYTSEQKIKYNHQFVNEIFKGNNLKYKVSQSLPENIYYLTAFEGLQANPEEAYISPIMLPSEDIVRVFYKEKGDQ